MCSISAFAPEQWVHLSSEIIFILYRCAGARLCPERSRLIIVKNFLSQYLILLYQGVVGNIPDARVHAEMLCISTELGSSTGCKTFSIQQYYWKIFPLDKIFQSIVFFVKLMEDGAHTLKELAEYEGVPEGPQLSEEDLIADGFEAQPAWFFALVAERRGVVVGYALCNRAYSSWTRRAFYLEDLYVRPGARRARVGRQLLRHVCQMAVAERVTRVDWHVLESNATARAFYAGLGARDLRASEGRTAMRLDEPHIARLAAEREPAAAER